MYARGMTVHGMQVFLAEMYSVEFFDALRMKILEDGVVRTSAV